MELSREEKIFLLKLARRAIEHYLKTGKELELRPEEVPSEKLVENGACFVTLEINKELRGCIGSLEAHRPLFQDVISNAIAAAVGDPRFFPLTLDELKKVEISISILSKPEPVELENPEKIVDVLIPHKHGLILQNGFARATFLPVVWEQLPDKISFLEHLSIKAGLGKDGWKDRDTKYMIYTAEEFSESELGIKSGE